MYYNKGLAHFINTKQLKAKQAINSFLKHKGITEFTAKDQRKVSVYLSENFHAFAAFVDLGIKQGTLVGKDVKVKPKPFNHFNHNYWTP
jgi:hypothetical protein